MRTRRRSLNFAHVALAVGISLAIAKPSCGGPLAATFRAIKSLEAIGEGASEIERACKAAQEARAVLGASRSFGRAGETGKAFEMMYVTAAKDRRLYAYSSLGSKIDKYGYLTDKALDADTVIRREDILNGVHRPPRDSSTKWDIVVDQGALRRSGLNFEAKATVKDGVDVVLPEKAPDHKAAIALHLFNSELEVLRVPEHLDNVAGAERCQKYLDSKVNRVRVLSAIPDTPAAVRSVFGLEGGARLTGAVKYLSEQAAAAGKLGDRVKSPETFWKEVRNEEDDTLIVLLIHSAEGKVFFPQGEPVSLPELDAALSQYGKPVLVLACDTLSHVSWSAGTTRELEFDEMVAVAAKLNSAFTAGVPGHHPLRVGDLLSLADKQLQMEAACRASESPRLFLTIGLGGLAAVGGTSVVVWGILPACEPRPTEKTPTVRREHRDATPPAPGI